MPQWWINAIGWVGAVTCSLNLAPQIVKIMRTHETAALSKTTLFILIFSQTLLGTYATLLHAWPVLLNNVVNCSMTLWTISMVYRYGGDQDSEQHRSEEGGQIPPLRTNTCHTTEDL